MAYNVDNMAEWLRSGIEPGSITWQATIITTRLRTLRCVHQCIAGHWCSGTIEPITLLLVEWKGEKKWIQHHTVPGWSPTPVLSGLKPR